MTRHFHNYDLRYRQRMRAAISQESMVERIGELRPDVEEAVLAAVGNCLTETNLSVGKRTVVSCYYWTYCLL